MRRPTPGTVGGGVDQALGLAVVPLVVLLILVACERLAQAL